MFLKDSTEEQSEMTILIQYAKHRNLLTDILYSTLHIAWCICDIAPNTCGNV